MNTQTQNNPSLQMNNTSNSQQVREKYPGHSIVLNYLQNPQNDPNLDSFVATNLNSLAQVSYKHTTTQQLCSTWTGRFQKALDEIRPDLKLENQGTMETWINLLEEVQKQKKVHMEIRCKINNWLHVLESDDEDLIASYNEEVASIVEYMSNRTQYTIEDALDFLNVNYLKSYNDLNEIEKLTLSVSISYIINTLSTDMAFELSQKLPNLPDEILRLIAPSSVDLDSINTKKFTHVIKVKQFIAAKNIHGAMGYILKEKLKLHELMDEADEEEVQVLDILEYMLKHIPIWNKVKDPSEAYYLTHFSHLMDIILRDTILSTHIGEKTSLATKEVMAANLNNLNVENSATISASTPSNKIVGRKIDIIIKDDEGNELSLLEFKGKQQPRTLLQQQGKSIRSNKCILFKLLQEGLASQAQDLTKIIAMDVGGHTGSLYSIERITEEVACTKHIGKIMIADNLRGLDEHFVESLRYIYYWKAHLVKQADVLSKCQRAVQVEQNLDFLSNRYDFFTRRGVSDFQNSNSQTTSQIILPPRSFAAASTSANTSASASTSASTSASVSVDSSPNLSNGGSNRKRKRADSESMVYPHSHFFLNWPKSKKENNNNVHIV